MQESVETNVKEVLPEDVLPLLMPWQLAAVHQRPAPVAAETAPKKGEDIRSEHDD